MNPASRGRRPRQDDALVRFVLVPGAVRLVPLMLVATVSACAAGAPRVAPARPAPPHAAEALDVVSARLRNQAVPSIPGALRTFGDWNPWMGAFAVAFSDDGTLLAWATTNRITVEEAATGRVRFTSEHPRIAAVGFTGSGLVVATATETIALGADGTARWTQPIAALALATRDDRITLGVASGDLVDLDPKDGREIARRHHALAANDRLVAVRYTEGGALVSVATMSWTYWRGDQPTAHVQATGRLQWSTTRLLLVDTFKRFYDEVDLSTGVAKHVVGRAVGAVDGVAGERRTFGDVASPDGRTLAILPLTAGLILADRISGATTARVGYHDDLVISPDGREAFYKSTDGAQHIDLATGSALPPVDHPDGFSPDGSRFVSILKAPANIVAVRGRDGSHIRDVPFAPVKESVNFVTMLSNDVVAFTVEHQADAATRIVNVTSGATREVPFKVQSLVGVAVSPQRDRIAGANIIRGVEGSDVIDLATGHLLRHLPQGRGFLEFASDGHALVNYDYKARASRWDLDTGKVLGRGTLVSAERLAYSPDGELLAMKVQDEPRLVIYETKSFKVVADLPLGSVGHGFSMLAFTPDGTQLVLGLPDGRIGVFAAPHIR